MTLHTKQIIVWITKHGYRKTTIYNAVVPANQAWDQVLSYGPIWAVWIEFDPTSQAAKTRKYFHSDNEPIGRSYEGRGNYPRK